MSPKKSSRLLDYALVFAAAYLLSHVLLRFVFPERFTAAPPETGIELTAMDRTIRDGHHPILIIKNRTDTELTLPARCPLPPVDIFWVDRPGTPGESIEQMEDVQPTLPCEDDLTVAAGTSLTIDLGPWKYAYFSQVGTYEARLILPDDVSEEEISARFSLHEAGMIVKMFRTFVTRPFLNILIFIASYLPGRSLGFSIIFLTLLVKLLLFFPTQRSLEGQKKMQALQPKMQEMKKKFASDPQRMQKETMKLWKENHVNPVQSCLPMLLQFPVLIGLFFVIRDGSSLELSRHLIYPFYQHLSWSFGTTFLGMDLTVPNITIFPIGLAVSQYMQMKLSFHFAKKKKGDLSKKKEKKTKWWEDPQEMQQTVMLYALPLMIGFFAFQFPAAVSLYWGVSTIFGIGQQIVVNRRTG